MEVEIKGDEVTIDAQTLSKLFGNISPLRAQELIRDGKISILFERGIEEDRGRIRISFTYADEGVRLTCDSAGTILSAEKLEVVDKNR